MILRFSLSTLLLRLAVGAIFILHGQPKLAHPENFVAFFTNHGIPGGSAMVIFVGVVELLGGILLVAGLLTRPAAFLLAVDMLVALFVVELREGFALGAQFVTMLLVGNLVLLFMGSGNAAIDASIKQHRYLLSRFFVLVALFVLPLTLHAAGVGGGGSSPVQMKNEPAQNMSSEPRPEHVSGAQWCDDLKSMDKRIRCRLNLSDKDIAQELAWSYNPEECRVMPIRDVDGRARCIARYRAFQPCWEKAVGEARTQCARNVLMKDLALTYVQQCEQACLPTSILRCCRTPKQLKEFQDLLVKFWMYDFSEQAEESSLSKKRIADFVNKMEQAKQDYNKAKTFKQKEALVKRVWTAWKAFAKAAKINAGKSIDGVLKDLREVNKK